jgi:predicted RNA-binding protein with RPS1 domain
VKVLEVDKSGKIRLSRKELLKNAEEKAGPAGPVPDADGPARGEERRRGGKGPSET